MEDEEGAVEQDCEEAVARLAAAVDEDTEEALPPTNPPPPPVVAEVEEVDE